MRQTPTIPSAVWGQTEMNAFTDASGLGQSHQKVLCSFCVREGIVEVPEFILMVNGTSLCTQHL